MTINNRDAYFASLWDWGFLRGCFGPTIEPTDLDGFVERKGRFLVLETKLPGVEIKTGQEITFKALQATGLFTVFIIWGRPGMPEKIRIMTRHGVHERDCGIDDLKAFCAQWYKFANEAW